MRRAPFPFVSFEKPPSWMSFDGWDFLDGLYVPSKASPVGMGRRVTGGEEEYVIYSVPTTWPRRVTWKSSDPDHVVRREFLKDAGWETVSLGHSQDFADRFWRERMRLAQLNLAIYRISESGAEEYVDLLRETPETLLERYVDG